MSDVYPYQKMIELVNRCSLSNPTDKSPQNQHDNSKAKLAKTI